MSDLSAIAAFCALGLGIANSAYNVWNETNKPIRVRQQESRDQLRNILNEAQMECRAAARAIKNGEVLNSEAPDILKHIEDRVDKVTQDGLKSPSANRLHYLKSHLSSLTGEWDREDTFELERLMDEAGVTVDAAAKGFRAKQSRLQDDLNESLKIINEYLEVLTEIDNGSRRTYKMYKK